MALVVLAFAPVALDMTDVMQSDAVSWRLLIIGGLPTWLVTAFVWRKRAGLGLALLIGGLMLLGTLQMVWLAWVEVEYAGWRPAWFVGLLLLGQIVFLARVSRSFKFAPSSDRWEFLRAFAGIVMFFVGMNVLAGPPPHHRRRERREEAETREALVAAATCLNEHRATAGSYPDTLALACGEVARSMAKNRSHRFSYVPKARVAGGQAERYELTARAVPRSVFIESYLIDDSGAVHATGERRPATASDPAR